MQSGAGLLALGKHSHEEAVLFRTESPEWKRVGAAWKQVPRLANPFALELILRQLADDTSQAGNYRYERVDFLCDNTDYPRTSFRPGKSHAGDETYLG